MTSHAPRSGTRVRRPRCLAGIVAAAAALLGACGQAEEPASPPTISEETFVQIVVELREAERESESSDSATVVFERRKEQVLARHDASAEDVRRFVEVHHGQFELMNRVWERINEQLKHVPESGSDTTTAGAHSPAADSGVTASETTARPGTDVARSKGPRQ